MENTLAQPVRVLTGHAGGTTSLSVSSDSTTLVSGGYDSTFRVWDMTTGQQKQALPGNRRGHAAFWPSRDLLLAGGLWGDTKLYATKDWQVHATVEQFDGLWWMAFAPEGATLATVHADEPILLWDTATWRPKGKIETPTQCYSVAFIPNTETMAITLWPSRIAVVEMVTGREIKTFEAHCPGIFCITVSSDCRLAASGGADKNVVLWDTSSWTMEATFTHHASVICATFSPDNQYLLTGTLDGTISFWSLT